MTSNNLRLLGLLTAIIAVGSGALLGVWFIRHKSPHANLVIPPQYLVVTMDTNAIQNPPTLTFEISYDGTNWQKVESSTLKPEAVQYITTPQFIKSIKIPIVKSITTQRRLTKKLTQAAHEDARKTD
jgi:hypothetical protein